MRDLLLKLFDLVLLAAAGRYETYMALVRLLGPRALDALGRARAERLWRRAARPGRGVPAWQAHRTAAGSAAAQGPQWPETDKATYVNRHGFAERCWGGRLPLKGWSVDESSGSTGTPYNWIRSLKERRQTHVFIRYFTRHVFGRQPDFVINGFSMGAWATGVNMGQALENWGIVKNTGPDLAKIFSTLKTFGPERDYLILGYPPFLKQLADQAADAGLNLKEWRLRALVGGEGMSEGLRRYLLAAGFGAVSSGYGATDLEIGMAGETRAAIALRQAAEANPALGRDLFGEDPRLPMVFQYNPLMHWAEVNAAGELVFTLSRAAVLSPRLRYNIHDAGGRLRFDEATAVLARHGLSWAALGVETASPGREKGPLPLPFLWVYGRSDSTVSVMGANLYPEDAEAAVYSDPELAARTRGFCQGLWEGEHGAVRPRYAFAVEAGAGDGDEAGALDDPDLARRYRDALVATLCRQNADFRSAWAENPADLEPVIELWAPGTGPFAAETGRIKQVRKLA